MLVYITLPLKTCTVERYFSTLRRDKTWSRSTRSEERIDGLYMISVHKKKIDDEETQAEFIDNFINNLVLK